MTILAIAMLQEWRARPATPAVNSLRMKLIEMSYCSSTI